MKFSGARNMAIGKLQKSRDQMTKEDISLTIGIHLFLIYIINNKTYIYIDRAKDKNSQVITEDDLIPRSYKYKKLKLRRIPFFFWLIGLSFFCAGFLLIYNILVGQNSDKKIINAFFGKSAWEYVILGFIFIIGVSMFVVAKYETITLDKTLYN